MRLAVWALEDLGLGWRDARRGGPPWLSSELTATPEARERLSRWIASGAAVDTPEARAAAARRVPVMGDGSMFADVVAALECIPLLVPDHLCRHVFMVALGRRAFGVMCVEPARPADAEEPRRVVGVVGPPDQAPEDLAAIVGHEVAHAWLEPVRKAWTCAERAVLSELRELEATWAAEDGRRSRFDLAVSKVEREAHALAVSWGFRGWAADPEKAKRQ